MSTVAFTIRVIAQNPHREDTMAWRADDGHCDGRLRCPEHCRGADSARVRHRTVGVGSPPGISLRHFAGLESPESGKHIEPWIEIIHGGLRP